ncbi:hypothetical protein K503DRAFT_776213 [Rhizopogon vinicolor AM-OR11-026]|uniref:Uncharacterized protein n=1 Tax=Rhizopogon vinicolor AM-OR11-026 TaxID=1314800 RepID=A0A1B7MJT6_9AGAM|nr:hypothetical protein K503DRAFT_776213 [Rhizopogon vinicolor AM-OR11-026]
MAPKKGKEIHKTTQLVRLPMPEHYFLPTSPTTNTTTSATNTAATIIANTKTAPRLRTPKVIINALRLIELSDPI